MSRFNRRRFIKSSTVFSAATFVTSNVTALSVPTCFAEEDVEKGFKIGTCDWSINMPLSIESFEFAQRNGLQGIQYSFDAKEKGLDLRLPENRDIIRETVKRTGVGISSLGIGLLNKVPLATTDEAEQLVVECIETMAKLKEEAAELDDRDLSAKVSPHIVLLAFFGKADIEGSFPKGMSRTEATEKNATYALELFTLS